MTLKAVERVTQETVKRFAQDVLAPAQIVRTDALKALNVLAVGYHHIAKVSPLNQACKWLPWIHVVVSNFKSLVLGTYHGISGRYVQEYLDE